jgi:pyruvate-formate lyase-activating enzyme
MHFETQVIKNNIKKNFPQLTNMYRLFKIKKQYNSQYFIKNKMYCLKIAHEISTIPFAELQKKNNQINDKNEEHPIHAVIEINNTCNINCLMCKTNLSTRPKKSMKEELFETSLQKITALGIHHVELHTIGDPLANPKLEMVFKLMRKYAVQTSITTNGLLLLKYIPLLLQYRDVCSNLSFSIDGASKATYEKIRAGGQWEQLLKNLEAAKKHLQTNGHFIQISMVVSKDNVNEIGQYIQMFRSYVKFPFRDLKFTFVNSLSPDNSYFKSVNLFENHTFINTPCSLIAKPQPYILVDGKVSVCCRDYDGSMIIGDIAEQEIDDIFKAPEFGKIRKAHKTGELNQYNLCNSCYVVDHRISKLFNKTLEHILYYWPDQDAMFYQEKVNYFIDIFQKNTFAEKYHHLLQS